MGEPNRDACLIAVGVAYPVATFTLLLALRGQPMGVLSVSPFAFALLVPVAVVGLVLVLGAAGVRFRSGAVVGFVAWMAVVAVLQLMIFALASAVV